MVSPLAPIRSVLIATDFSPDSERALELGIDVGDLDLQYAWLVGYGAASFGRLAVNGGGAVVEAVRNGR